MTGSHVVSLLTKKYAQLLGESEFSERMVEDCFGLDAIIAASDRSDQRKKEIEETLVAIETVIWLFDPEWDPATVRPNYPRKRHLKPGMICKAAYGILRDAEIPMASREIARVAAERLGYGKLEEREMARIDSAIYISLKKRVGTTLQIVSQKPIRWALIQRDEARPRAKERSTAKSVARENCNQPDIESAAVEMPRRSARRLAS